MRPSQLPDESLFDALGLPFVELDGDGTVVFANAACRTLADGLPWIGRRFDELFIPAPGYDPVSPGTLAGLDPAVGRSLEVEVHAAARQVAWRVGAVTLDGLPRWFAVARDVTAERRAQTLARVLDRATALIARNEDPRPALAHVVDLFVPQLARACLVHVAADASHDAAVFVAHADGAQQRWLASLTRDCAVPTAAATALLRAVYSTIGPRTVRADDAGESSPLGPDVTLLRMLGTRQALVHPLVQHGRALGALVLGAAPDDDLVALATTLAERVAATLDAAWVIAAERHARSEAELVQQRLAFLNAAGMRINDALDANGALRALVDLAVPGMGEFCIAEVERPDGSYERVGRHGNPAHAPRIEVLLAHDGPLFVQQDGDDMPCIVGTSSVTQLAALAVDAEHFRHLEELDSHSVLVVPLAVGGHLFGRLYAGLCDRGRTYVDDDLAVARDLAHRGARALHRARLVAELREALAGRDDLISTASHELRTPLTTLSLQLELLSRRRTVQSLDERVPTLVRQVQRLVSLLDHLLDVARVTSGRIDLAVRPGVDFGEITREVVARYGDESHQSGSALALEVQGRVEGEWDPVRLDQVVTNLVSNAIKYGDGKPVSVTLGLSGDGHEAVLSVRDHGIGIDPSQHRRIFDRFERAVDGRSYRGNGLGLWIVRQIVEAMGGSIEVAGARGEGATFTARIPVRTAR